MIDINNDTLVEFETTEEQSSYIKVIGVGGGGNNAVNHMSRQGITGVDFIVCNTDMKALNASPVAKKISLGRAGLGAGNNPEVAKAAALEGSEEIKKVLEDNTKMLFITAGMGGGTGTGAAPVIAEIAKSIKLEDSDPSEILVVAIVTMPFSFEGKKRREQAMRGVEELRKHVDSMLIINNEKLREAKGPMPVPIAFAEANDILLTAAKGIAEIITLDAYVNIDFRDVNSVMSKSGTALMGVGQASGDDRAMAAIEMAATSPLLNDNDIHGAKDILLYFSTSSESPILMDEISDITDHITSLTGSTDTNVIWGMGTDESLGADLKITMIATGFDAKTEEPQTHPLDEQQPQQQPKEEPKSEPIVSYEPTVETSNQPKIVHVLEMETEEKLPADTTFNFCNRAAKLQEKAPAKAPEQTLPADEMGMTLVDSTSGQPIHTASLTTAEAPVPVVEAPAVEAAVEEQPVMSLVHDEAPKPMTHTIPAPEPAFANARNVEDRIRIMHDMLKNKIHGAEAIENMTTEQLQNGELPLGDTLLTAREAPSSMMGSDGLIHQVPGIDGLPD
jgi:cell division protein FtsZ